MLLDLDDVQIRARLSSLSHDRIRLTLDYPRRADYRDKIMNALADLLRPSPKAGQMGAEDGRDGGGSGNS